MISYRLIVAGAGLPEVNSGQASRPAFFESIGFKQKKDCHYLTVLIS